MTTQRLGVRAAMVQGSLVTGDVIVQDGVIASVGVTPPAREGIAVPGYIDLQVNGFGGVDLLTAEVEDYRIVEDALASTGVTAYQPTLVSSPEDVLHRGLERAAKARDESTVRILGVHLEGPFIDPTRKGAHDGRYIVPPDIDFTARLCGWGPVTMMTIAPELPGGMELLRWLVERGIVVSVGHSDADAEAAHRAYNAGARSVTHLHNAQRRFASRDPGVSGVAQTRPDVTVMAIADLVHLSRETLLLAYLAARGRFAVVTDSISAAPGRTGEFTLGDRTIRVDESAAYLPDGTLAGSVLSMDRAVRNLVSIGVPFMDAIHAATAAPAALMSRNDLGTLRPMTPADVTVLDDELHVVRTVVEGREVWARG